jgi:hypothetical protein
MGLSKHQEHDMISLQILLFKMISGLVRPILLSSLEKWEKTYLSAKYILMKSMI